MLGLRATVVCLGCVLPLVGCATSETRTAVSAADVSAGKYRKIAVFLESGADAPSETVNVQIWGPIIIPVPAPYRPYKKAEIEEAVLSTLISAGAEAVSSEQIFAGRELNAKDKALLVRKSFDAVLYVAVLVNGQREKQIEGASHNGYLITIGGETRQIDEYDSKYELKSDGTVWDRTPTLHVKSDLQDTKTNKQVWTAETIATGGTLVLLKQVSSQIAQKMRDDGII